MRRGIPANLASIANDVKEMEIDADAVHRRIKAIRQSLHYDDGTPLNAVDFYDIVCPYMAGATGAQSTVSRWEKEGKNNPLPPADVMYRIARLGGYTMDELLFGSNREPKKKETTWRDFCRVISDMRHSMPMKVEINDRQKAVEEKRNISCNISIILDYYVNEHLPHYQSSTAGDKTTHFLETLQDILASGNDIIKKYEHSILQDALLSVPDEVPQNREEDCYPFAELIECAEEDISDTDEEQENENPDEK